MAENYYCILTGAVVFDCFTKKIPNALILTGLLNGCFCQMLRGGPYGLWRAASAILILFLAAYPVYLLRGLGAGDVKLFCVTASYLGGAAALKILFASLLIGAVIGLVSRKVHPKQKTFCYSPAILLGVLVWEMGVL